MPSNVTSPRAARPPASRPLRPVGLAVGIAALAVVYVAVGRLGLAVAPVHSFATLVWPPTGIALAALLLYGRALWPGVALGALAVNASIGAPLPLALAIAIGNTAEAVAGAWLVRRASGAEWALERPRDAVAFVVLAALLGTTLSASIGVGALLAAGIVPPGELAGTWRVWWLGDALGALVVAPPLLAWWRAPRLARRPRRLGEAAVVGAAIVGGSALVFLHPPLAAATGFVQACMLIPVLMWGAVRFAVRGATAVVFLASAVAIAGTASGLGPFVEASLSSSLLHLQVFIAVVATAMLVVGAVTAERAETLRRLEASEDALRAAGRDKDEFLAMLSHELRNPLSPIVNGLHILRHAAGPEQAARALAVLERQTGQLTRLVDDLLDVTRVSRGKITLRKDRVELGAIVRRTVEDHQPLFSSRNVALALAVDVEPQWLDADPTRLRQIVGNLLQNAAKFTNPGGHVAVRVWRASGRAVIRVADDGIGMSPDLLGRLFQPFTQGDKSLHRPQGGLGLGLALVKGLVEMHGGDVRARSGGEGRGSELTVELPVPEAIAAAARRERPRAAPAARRRVLVIEDNADAAQSLRESLELNGHEVVVAHDGEEGLARARSFRPEVVLCDIGLPGLDGYAVARRIRLDPSLSPVLVAVTGYALPEDRRRALEAGFDRHVAKPFALEEIADLVGSLDDAPGDRDRPARLEDGLRQ